MFRVSDRSFAASPFSSLLSPKCVQAAVTFRLQLVPLTGRLRCCLWIFDRFVLFNKFTSSSSHPLSHLSCFPLLLLDPSPFLSASPSHLRRMTVTPLMMSSTVFHYTTIENADFVVLFLLSLPVCLTAGDASVLTKMTIVFSLSSRFLLFLLTSAHALTHIYPHAACFAALRSVITVELLGLEKLTNAFGLLLLPQGIATIIGTPFAGQCPPHEPHTAKTAMAETRPSPSLSPIQRHPRPFLLRSY